MQHISRQRVRGGRGSLKDPGQSMAGIRLTLSCGGLRCRQTHVFGFLRISQFCYQSPAAAAATAAAAVFDDFD